MRFCSLLFLIFVLVTGLHAQKNINIISGQLRDAKTREPIAYVNIGLKATSIGTASGPDGNFVFKYPKDPKSDTVIFSCIGYGQRRLAIRDLRSPILILLDPAALELPEVTIIAHSGLDLLKEVIRKIPANYDTSAVEYTAFYQENIWLGDAELLFLEAVADIYRPFKREKKPNDQIRILKGRKKQLDFSRDPQLYHWLGGTSNGLRGCLSEDLVKYHNALYSPFNPRNYQYYTYDHVETINDGKQRLIILEINPSKPSRKALMKMRLVIDESSMAIVRYKFELTPEGISRTSRKDKHIGYTIMTKVVHATLEYHRFVYEVSYKQINGKWYLNRLNRHFEINVNSKRRDWENHPWIADANLFMTDLKTTGATPITEADIGSNETPLTMLIGNDMNDEFWEDYNFVRNEHTPLPIKADSSVNNETQPVRKHYSNRENGFTRADTLRGKLTPMRSCYDVTFYHLDVAVDLENRSVKGSNIIRFNAVQPFSQFQVDLYENMKVDKIVFQGNELKYTREFNAIFVDFPRPFEKGESSEVKVYYHGVPKEPDYSIPMDGGVLWDKDSLGNHWAQVVCQGSGASLWWPNKDHLSDEPDSMKIWITVPDDYIEISNGNLIRTTNVSSNQRRWEWSVSYPINNYNVTFNIGKYAQLKGKYINGDTTKLNFYYMPYQKSLAEKILSSVREMLRVFESSFGKYPFSRDGFTLVESLYPMEHQSGVCIGKLSPDTIAINRLMWHESAHEWWGNAVSCTDIADLWIHEAFATLAEYIMLESKYGKNESSTFWTDEANAVRGREPIVGVYDVNHIHYDITDMYSKGSLMLNTFRNVLRNEQKWKALLLGIQNEFRYKCVNTTELIQFINATVGEDFSWFFQQYLYYAKLPALKIRIDERESSIVVRYKWQCEVPDFRMPVKITKEPERFDWIHPTSNWQTITLKSMSSDDFEVDEDNFLLNVVYEENDHAK